MRRLVVTVALFAGLAVAAPVGAAESALAAPGPQGTAAKVGQMEASATAWLAMRRGEGVDVHYYGINDLAPPREWLDTSGLVNHVGLV